MYAKICLDTLHNLFQEENVFVKQHTQLWLHFDMYKRMHAYHRIASAPILIPPNTKVFYHNFSIYQKKINVDPTTIGHLFDHLQWSKF